MTERARRWSVNDVECKSLDDALETLTHVGGDLYAEWLPGDPEGMETTTDGDGKLWVCVETQATSYQACPRTLAALRRDPRHQLASSIDMATADLQLHLARETPRVHDLCEASGRAAAQGFQRALAELVEVLDEQQRMIEERFPPDEDARIDTIRAIRTWVRARSAQASEGTPK